MANSLDLVNLFSAVKDSLVENQDSLNEGDTLHHDHGDNMVEIFKAITEAMETKKDADPADQLLYASQILRQKSQSGTATVYAEGLQKAAEQFTGKSIDVNSAMTLVQTLLNGGQSQAQQPAPSTDLVGSLLSSLTGGQSEDDGKLDAADLLSTGMKFLAAKQNGDSDMEALVSAVVSSSAVGQKPHRAQSGSVVANTLLKTLGSFMK